MPDGRALRGRPAAHAALVAGLPVLALLVGAGCHHHHRGRRGGDLATELVAEGFDQPLWVGAPPGDSARLFVVERTGRIRIVDEDGDVLAAPFLDVSALVSLGGEQGLLGLAFHPGYAANGRFFVDYTDLAGDTRVVEYRVSADPDRADTAPVQTVLAIDQPFANHNGGNLAFGPDGMLYIGTGDGGGANDPNGRAQDGMDLLGKMLRLDVDLPAPFVPADNPFVTDAAVRDEIWALGLRNPWRYAFDRLNGDLYIADVGQNEREEIDVQPGGSPGGENYGWRCMEGFACTGLSGCTCNDAVLTLPVHDYGHGGGNCSITGGHVYRGTAIPELRGTYFFADFCSGRIWTFRMEAGVVTDFEERSDELDPPGHSITRVTSFGEDAAGELYIVDNEGGQVFRVVDRHRLRGPLDGQAAGPDCGSLADGEGRLARLVASGSTSLSRADLVLTVLGAAPGRCGLFVYGGARASSPFGADGRCVGAGPQALLRTRRSFRTDEAGSLELRFLEEVLRTPEAAAHLRAGTTWYAQFLYRDPTGPRRQGASDVVALDLLP